MTSFKLFGAALVLSALVATPASAWEAISEPGAAAAMDPSFSVYSSDHNAYGSSRATASRSFNNDVLAAMPLSAKPHRAHRAPIKHY